MAMGLSFNSSVNLASWLSVTVFSFVGQALVSVISYSY